MAIDRPVMAPAVDARPRGKIAADRNSRGTLQALSRTLRALKRTVKAMTT